MPEFVRRRIGHERVVGNPLGVPCHDDRMETQTITAWTLIQEIPIPNDVGHLLVGDEKPVAAYKTFRDSAIFTTKRLIVRDAQGLSGKKVEIYSLPYSRIDMWSSERWRVSGPQRGARTVDPCRPHQDQP